MTQKYWYSIIVMVNLFRLFAVEFLKDKFYMHNQSIDIGK